MIKAFVIILCIAGISACTKVIDADKFIPMSYAQTQCADPWFKGNASDSATLVNVKHYLDSLGLMSSNLSITSDGSGELCSACACRTGKRIHVFPLEGLESSRYEAIGFVKD